MKIVFSLLVFFTSLVVFQTNSLVNASSSWSGVYYDEKDLTGNTIDVTSDALKFNWQYDAPHAKVPYYDYSASFYKKVQGNQDYFVQTYADDGIRVKANNQLIIDRWSNAAGTYDSGLITGLGAGEHTVQTDYFENTGKAVLYAEVVPLGDWYGYYYNNTAVEGTPENARMIAAESDGSLKEDHGYNAPISGVSKDEFSAKYVTAKAIEAGQYIVRAGADDGVRVYVDGKLVLDRWTNSRYREDAVKLDINDNNQAPNGQQNIHWIEVEYYDKTNHAKVDVSIEPYSKNDAISTDGWYAEYYSNTALQGIPYVEGGTNATNKIEKIDFNWGLGSPHISVPVDDFSVRYQKKFNLSSSKKYLVNAEADNAVRIYVDDELVIDKWNSSVHSFKELMEIPKGEHIVRVEHYEKTIDSKLKVEFTEVNQDKFYDTVTYNYTFDYMVDRQVRYGSNKSDATGSWIDATRNQIAYYVNPNNFNAKDSASYFQFMKLSETANINTKEVNENILTSSTNKLAGLAKVFKDAGNDYGINEVYLLSHALHETGYGKSDLSKGVKVNDKIVYNMYGIAAYDGTAVLSGSEFAYKNEWFTPEAAIRGGAEWIANNYIKRGQDTLFKMKWNPDSPATHQYATDVGWAEKITSTINKVYNSIQNYVLFFEEPIFNEQPDSGYKDIIYPKGVYGLVNVDNLNFRTGPSTSYDIIRQLSKNTKVEVIGKNDVDGWYNIIVDGKEGWVAAKYIDVLNLLQVDLTSGTLNVRSDSSTNSEIIGSLVDNRYVAGVMSDNSMVQTTDWYNIGFDGKNGWVHKDFVNRIE
ncbi:PA14 domain-containing protein [Paraliobacillus sp. PM-2]|uniref:PA14 domain-containing protein n=1 Tax=Paraliobacillus sp. PM-2 TaxID=1462524 RepID=UPI00159EF11B|nr:PA14 domain-containing protein [Paraliobacillus sp. PM-2]